MELVYYLFLKRKMFYTYMYAYTYTHRSVGCKTIENINRFRKKICSYYKFTKSR